MPNHPSRRRLSGLMFNRKQMATAAPAAAAVSFGATAMNLNILSHDLVKRTANDSDQTRILIEIFMNTMTQNSALLTSWKVTMNIWVQFRVRDRKPKGPNIPRLLQSELRVQKSSASQVGVMEDCFWAMLVLVVLSVRGGLSSERGREKREGPRGKVYGK